MRGADEGLDQPWVQTVSREINPLSPLSDPLNGDLKLLTSKANFLAPAKALRDGDGARKPKP